MAEVIGGELPVEIPPQKNRMPPTTDIVPPQDGSRQVAAQDSLRVRPGKSHLKPNRVGKRYHDLNRERGGVVGG